MMIFFNFDNLEQYLYSPQTLWHNVKTSYKLIGVILHIIILFCISNEYIFFYIIVSTLVFLISAKYLYLTLLMEVFQRLLYYLCILVLFILSINNSRYLGAQTKLIHFGIIVNYNWCKYSIKFFLYSSTLKTFNKFLRIIILYCSLYSSKVIIRVYLIFFSYLIFNQLFFISAKNEDILCSYIPYTLFYNVTKYYINIFLITISLSSNYIHIVRCQINNRFTTVYLKKMKINNNNMLFIITKIFIVFLQDVIQSCDIDACVIYYRKACPPYRKVWLHY